MRGFNPAGAQLTWIFFPYCLLCYAGMTWLVYGAYAKFERAKINFYITDIWTAMLLLTPTFYLLALVLDPKNAAVVTEWDRDQLAVRPALAILFVSQCAGMFFGRLLSAPRAGEALPRRLGQALAIFFGGILGMALLIPVVISFVLAVVATLIVSACPPLGLLPLVLPAAWIWRKRAKR